MNMPIALPRTYRPHPGAKIEKAGFATPAEWKLLAAMTDGKLDMTEYGVPSAYMEGSSSGNYKDSKPTQTKSVTQGSSRTTNTGAGYKSPSAPNRSAEEKTGNAGSSMSGVRQDRAAVEKTGNAGGTMSGVRLAQVHQNIEMDDFNRNIHNALTSTERPNFVMGSNAETPIGRNGELQVFKDLMDQGVGLQRNPFTENDQALGKTAKILSGETIRGSGAGEVANVLINRARNPRLYNPDDALKPRQFESLKLSDPKIVARMRSDVPGNVNFDRALNIATSGLSNPDTLNPEAMDATDFQAKSLADKMNHGGVNVGGNVFGQHYTKPTVTSSLGMDMDGSQFGGSEINTMPIGKPRQIASITPVSDDWRNDPKQYSGTENVPAVAPNSGVQNASFSWGDLIPTSIKDKTSEIGTQMSDGMQKINSIGPKNAVILAKLANAFGFLGGGGGVNHNFNMYNDRDHNNAPEIRSGIIPTKLPMAKSATTKTSLLAELETTTDPNRYAEIIQLLNNKYDPNTIRYGLQMRAA